MAGPNIAIWDRSMEAAVTKAVIKKLKKTVFFTFLLAILFLTIYALPEMFIFD